MNRKKNIMNQEDVSIKNNIHSYIIYDNYERCHIQCTRCYMMGVYIVIPVYILYYLILKHMKTVETFWEQIYFFVVFAIFYIHLHCKTRHLP
jgi:hypothetical protein